MTKPSSIIGTGNTAIIGGVEFTYGWTRYTTSAGDRERAFYRVNGKRVPEAAFWAARRDAKAVAEVLAETEAA